MWQPKFVLNWSVKENLLYRLLWQNWSRCQQIFQSKLLNWANTCFIWLFEKQKLCSIVNLSKELITVATKTCFYLLFLSKTVRLDWLWQQKMYLTFMIERLVFEWSSKMINWWPLWRTLTLLYATILDAIRTKQNLTQT